MRVTWKDKAVGREVGTVEIEHDETLVRAWESEGFVTVDHEPEPVEDRSMAAPSRNRSMDSKKGKD